MGWKSDRWLKPGQWKLNGKKCKMADCGCCDIFNLKTEYQNHLDKKKIQETKGRLPRDIINEDR